MKTLLDKKIRMNLYTILKFHSELDKLSQTLKLVDQQAMVFFPDSEHFSPDYTNAFLPFETFLADTIPGSYMKYIWDEVYRLHLTTNIRERILFETKKKLTLAQQHIPEVHLHDLPTNHPSVRLHDKVVRQIALFDFFSRLSKGQLELYKLERRSEKDVFERIERLLKEHSVTFFFNVVLQLYKASVQMVPLQLTTAVSTAVSAPIKNGDTISEASSFPTTSTEDSPWLYSTDDTPFEDDYLQIAQALRDNPTPIEHEETLEIYHHRIPKHAV